MKKTLSFLFIMLLGLSLASCKKTEKEYVQVDPSLIGQNVEKPQEVVKNNLDNLIDVHVDSNSLFYSSKIHNSSYINQGILVTKNSNDYIGFYSLYTNSYILEECFYKDWVKYNVFQSGNYTYIEIIYENKRLYFDVVGNLIYETEFNGSSNTLDISDKVINNKVYLTIRDGYDYDNIKYLEYSKTGRVKSVYMLPEQEEIRPELPQDSFEDTPSLDQGDQYIDLDRVDLKDFGLEGYYFSLVNNLYTLFDDANNTVCSFAIPSDAHFTIVGRNLIYQQMFELPADAEKYDVVYEGKKIDFTSYKINLTNGEKTKLELDYIMRRSLPYKNAEGIYQFAVCEVIKVVDHHAEIGRAYLINGDGKILSEATGLQLGSMVQVGDNFYNTTNKILYDQNFKVISYLGAVNPQLDRNIELFICNYNGKTGAIDFDGRVAISFEYDKIETNYANDGKVLAFKNGSPYSIDYIMMTETKLGDTYERISNYGGVSSLYKAVDSKTNKVTIFNASGNILNTYYNKDSDNSKYFDFACQFNNKLFVFECKRTINSSKDYDFEFDTYCSEKLSRATNNYQNGKYDTVYCGLNEDDAITLADTNTLHYIKNNRYDRYYFKQKLTKKGYYTFDFKETNLSLYNVGYYPEDDPNTSRDESKYIVNVDFTQSTLDNKYTVRLDRLNTTYYFILKDSSDKYTGMCDTFNFYQEKGDNDNYPLIDVEINKEYNLNFTDHSELYFEFTPDFTMNYIFKGLEDCRVYDYSNYITITDSTNFTKGKTYLIRVTTNNKYQTNVKFTITPDTTNLDQGETKYNPISLSVETPIIAGVKNGQVYFVYECTQSEKLYLNFDSTVNAKETVLVNGKEQTSTTYLNLNAFDKVEIAITGIDKYTSTYSFSISSK